MTTCAVIGAGAWGTALADVLPRIRNAKVDVREDGEENTPDEPEEQAHRAEDDRLHRVETNEAVALFEDKKNDAADKRETGKRSRNVRGQTGRGRMRRDASAGTRRGFWRDGIDRIGGIRHDL